MLKLLSKLERTRNVVILGFVFLMAISLVLFFRPGGSGSTVEPAKSTEAIATVGGETITVGEFVTQKQTMQTQFSQFGGSLERMGYTDQRILDSLIMRKVAAQEAARLGLGASQAEVSERIRSYFSDASGKLTITDASGKLDMSKYQARVGDVATFERGIAEDIAREKLEAFVTASVQPSEEEVKEDYKRKNTSLDLTYAVVAADKLAEKIQPTDDELKSYFDKHQADYRFLVPQKRIRYVFIDQDKSGAKLEISDKELEDEYNNLDPKYKQAGVKAQQIVLRVATPALENTVREKAEGLVAKARGTTGSTTEQAFAELAKGNSEDPATAKNGGQLAGLVKKNPNKPDDPYQKVLDLQPGDVTDAIYYKNAFYILRRGDSVPKSFADAKPELLVSQRNRRGYGLAQKLAQRAQERLKETKDPQKVAQEFAAEANMSATEMVRETPLVKPGDDVPNIGSSQQFEDTIAPLNNVNDVGDRVGIKNGFAVPMLIEKKDPRIPDFEEVKEKVRQAVKTEMAGSQLESKAKEIIAAAKTPGDIKGAAEKIGITAKTETDYKIGTPLGDSGSSTLIDEPLFAAKAGDVLQSPIFLNGNYLVLGITKKKDADLLEFAKQRESLMESAASQRKGQVFSDYLTAVQDKMKREGRIKVYKDVMAGLQEEAAPVLPVRRNPRAPTR